MKYNGWTNYETWAVALWLDNEQSSQEYWNEVARECANEAATDGDKQTDASCYLADQLKEHHELACNELQGVDGTVFADLLNAAISEVNWYEIAKHYVVECWNDAVSEAA